MTPPIANGELRALDITTRLNGRLILDALNLPPLGAGQMVALLGPNGSGKSTLLKSLAGLVPASFGTLRLGAHNLAPLRASARAEHIRYLPQSLPGDIHLTVVESILVALRARSALSTHHALPIVNTTLTELGIGHLANRYLDELSGGQKQLVGLAQALSHEPQILLLDEPLASLDLNHQHHVMQLLGRLTQERKLLTLIVLHDLNSVLQYCGQALLMQNGALLASGAPNKVITAESLAALFSVRARIETCSQGRPYVLVDGLLSI